MNTTKEMLFNNENLMDEDGVATESTAKQIKLAARKRVEEYIAEKQLRENIGDFDEGL